MQKAATGRRLMRGKAAFSTQRITISASVDRWRAADLKGEDRSSSELHIMPHKHPQNACHHPRFAPLPPSRI